MKPSLLMVLCLGVPSDGSASTSRSVPSTLSPAVTPHVCPFPMPTAPLLSLAHGSCQHPLALLVMIPQPHGSVWPPGQHSGPALGAQPGVLQVTKVKLAKLKTGQKPKALQALKLWCAASAHRYRSWHKHDPECSRPWRPATKRWSVCVPGMCMLCARNPRLPPSWNSWEARSS